MGQEAGLGPRPRRPRHADLSHDGAHDGPMEIRFCAVAEDRPGPRWRALFERAWPDYHAWFLKEGDTARPSFVDCRTMLRLHMPELLPIWHELVHLAGGGDLEARMLSLYRPTPYMSGCSQAVWTCGDEPLLVRNYDYHPRFCEGTILRTQWHKPVLAMSDCLWGVLDGVNGDGLCVSLAFGGRRRVGDGFGIPLILRYVLEMCATTAEAVAVLCRVPSHMAYNITVVDATGAYKTVLISPGDAATVLDTPVATNHQQRITWHDHAEATGTVERERLLLQEVCSLDGRERFVDRFLEPPLFHDEYSRAFGTLYTAAYRPADRAVTFLWPAKTWEQRLDRFDESELLVRFRDAEVS
jgi:predicted choloylglycine hydrolase